MAIARKVKKPVKKSPAKAKKPLKKAKKKPVKEAVKKPFSKSDIKLKSLLGDVKKAIASFKAASWYDGMIPVDFIMDVMDSLEKKVK